MREEGQGEICVKSMISAGLAIAREMKPDLIVLQSRSPSCGVKQRYDGTFSGTLTEGAGMTAQLLMENGFHVVDVEDL